MHSSHHLLTLNAPENKKLFYKNNSSILLCVIHDNNVHFYVLM